VQTLAHHGKARRAEAAGAQKPILPRHLSPPDESAREGGASFAAREAAASRAFHPAAQRAAPKFLGPRASRDDRFSAKKPGP